MPADFAFSSCKSKDSVIAAKVKKEPVRARAKQPTFVEQSALTHFCAGAGAGARAGDGNSDGGGAGAGAGGGSGGGE